MLSPLCKPSCSVLPCSGRSQSVLLSYLPQEVPSCAEDQINQEKESGNNSCSVISSYVLNICHLCSRLTSKWVAWLPFGFWGPCLTKSTISAIVPHPLPPSWNCQSPLDNWNSVREDIGRDTVAHTEGVPHSVRPESRPV